MSIDKGNRSSRVQSYTQFHLSRQEKLSSARVRQEQPEFGRQLCSILRNKKESAKSHRKMNDSAQISNHPSTNSLSKIFSNYSLQADHQLPVHKTALIQKSLCSLAQKPQQKYVINSSKPNIFDASTTSVLPNDHQTQRENKENMNCNMLNLVVPKRSKKSCGKVSKRDEIATSKNETVSRWRHKEDEAILSDVHQPMAGSPLVRYQPQFSQFLLESQRIQPSSSKPKKKLLIEPPTPQKSTANTQPNPKEIQEVIASAARLKIKPRITDPHQKPPKDRQKKINLSKLKEEFETSESILFIQKYTDSKLKELQNCLK